jgi:glycolate oxidase FAD binding subunit
MPERLHPSAVEEARAMLAAASAAGRSVRILGAGTKRGWGGVAGDGELELSTTGLDRVLEHNAGDLTAVLGAGVPLARAQEVFAGSQQMLALDPYLGPGNEATVGGILATGDRGPLAHRYGAPRDLVLGMTVVLSDGTEARSGGQVIKNVAGYDLGKLFCGSFGTLGLIVSVNVRLHPKPQATATATGQTDDPGLLADAARALAAAPLELEALDLAWDGATGRLLARCAGVSAQGRAERASWLMGKTGLAPSEAVEDDELLWEAQRAGQRSATKVIVRVAARPSQLAEVVRAGVACGAGVVARAAIGLSFVTVDAEALDRLIEALPTPAPWVLLDAPVSVRNRIDPWGPGTPQAATELMRRVKARFDPTRTCNPGLFVAGI